MPKICPVCDTVYPDANAFCPVDGTTLHVVDLDGGLIGSVVADRYLVTDLLGEGGMGKVYKARHVRLPQQAAIKVLRKDMVSDPAAVARFNREASNASRIDDENVARVYDFGETSDGTVYLAMEFVAGRTLRDIVMKDGAMPPARATELVRQIAQGLDAAHKLKIIHRDLKPDNILVIEGEDGRDRAKVVDFGIAKAFGASEGQLTRTGFIVGTPEFMSPEQLLGEQLDPRSDVYALALVAYQLLTAALPFGGATPEAAMTGRLTKAPKRLDEATGRAWPESVQAVFDAALSREPEGRPESATLFARQLKEAFANAGSLPAAPAARPASATPVAAGSTRRISQVTEPVAAAPEKKSSGALIGIVAVVLLAGAGGAYAYMRSNGAEQGGAPPTAAPAQDAAVATNSQSSVVAPPSAPISAPKESTTAPTTSTTSAPPPAAPQPVAPTPSPVAEKVTKKGAPAVAAEDGPAEPSKPTPPEPVDAGAKGELDSLSSALTRRGVDAASAQKLAASLRFLAGRLNDPTLKTRAYFRLIDANVLAGDLNGACVAFRSAKGAMKGSAQAGELRRYEEQLGCS